MAATRPVLVSKSHRTTGPDTPERHFMETFAQDVRHALRLLRNAPGFAIAAIAVDF